MNGKLHHMTLRGQKIMKFNARNHVYVSMAAKLKLRKLTGGGDRDGDGGGDQMKSSSSASSASSARHDSGRLISGCPRLLSTNLRHSADRRSIVRVIFVREGGRKDERERTRYQSSVEFSTWRSPSGTK